MPARNIICGQSKTKKKKEVYVPETKFIYELTDSGGRSLADCGIRITRNTTSVYESVDSIVEFMVDPDKIQAANGWESSNGSDKHIYYLKEKNDGKLGWTYDDTEYIIEVIHERGTINTKIYQGSISEETAVNKAVFTNEYVNYATVEIPFTKTVTQDASVAPGAQDFELEVLNVYFLQPDSYADVTCTAEVETNGTGHYEGEILITGPANHVQEYICEGFAVREKNTGAENWTYSDAVYCVVPENDGGLGFQVYLAEMAVTDNGNYYEPVREPVDRMIFENTYTFTGSNNTFGPKTGDSSSLALWVIMCLASGATAGLFISWKKRKIQ